MFLVLTLFFIIGTFLGSFATVIIERMHNGQSGSWFGRSKCPNCHHILDPASLIPLFSYIKQNGKCKYCQSPISLFYPIVEGLFGTIWVYLGYFLIYTGQIVEIPIIIILFILFWVTGVYIVYDARYSEIPDKVILPIFYSYLLLIICALYFPILRDIIPGVDTYKGEGNLFYKRFFWDHILGAFLLYGFFILQILLPGGYYLLKQGAWKKCIELIISAIVLPITLITTIFRKDQKEKTDEDNIPTWIGGGDLRVALFIGLTLGMIHGIIAVALAYIIGSVYGIILIIQKGGKSLKGATIPFGPFLGMGWIISMLFYYDILYILQ